MGAFVEKRDLLDAFASAVHLQPTPLLDFETPAIEQLVKANGWRALPENERIRQVYDYVRNRIAFGYNQRDDLPASAVLADGFGQCNTKTILLMALLRAVGIACRFHGATIHKRLQKGVVTGVYYLLAPRDIIHSWAEVWFHERWTTLEGVILDDRYLDGLRAELPVSVTALTGFAVGIDNVQSPPVEWDGNDTYIQIKGVNRDLGVFDDPDSFYARNGRNLSGIKALIYEFVVRHVMNRRVARIRAGSAGCAVREKTE